jgi:hypothetical protein
VLLRHHGVHVTAVDEAGEFVARGVFAQPRQRLGQVGALQARTLADVRQAPRQQRNRRHHHRHQQKVPQFNGPRIDLRLAQAITAMVAPNSSTA